MNELQYFQRGEDNKVTITVLDSNGDAMDMSTYDGYAVILFYMDNLKVLEKYSKNVVTGYSQDIDTTNEATGVIVLNVQRSVTVNARVGLDVNFMVLTQLTDADFDESRFMQLTDATYCFTIADVPVSPIPDIS